MMDPAGQHFLSGHSNECPVSKLQIKSTHNFRILKRFTGKSEIEYSDVCEVCYANILNTHKNGLL